MPYGTSLDLGKISEIRPQRGKAPIDQVVVIICALGECRVLVLTHARRFAFEDGERDGSERAELFFARFVDAVEMHL
jgi:hypothetical protein